MTQNKSSLRLGKNWFFYLLGIVVLIAIGSGLFRLWFGPQMKPGVNLANPDLMERPGLITGIPESGIENSNPVVSIAQAISPAVVGITGVEEPGLLSRTGEEMTGSGVIFDASNGYIVTNNHVVQGSTRILVTLADGRELTAQLVGRDPHTDLAVLQIQAPNLVAVNFGDSDRIAVGETAVAIGNPLGMRFARSVTVGVISGLNRQLVTDEGYAYKLIQTDAAINPGNSGGALANAKGEIIGINTVKIAIPGFEGMGFAIPINQVKTVINSLIQQKEVIRPALGVRLKGEVTTEAAAYYQLPVDYGVVIEVHAGSPAEKAGLKDEDIIIAVDNQIIRSAADLQALMAQHQVGDTIQVKVIRRQKAGRKQTYGEITFPVILERLTTSG